MGSRARVGLSSEVRQGQGLARRGQGRQVRGKPWSGLARNGVMSRVRRHAAAGRRRGSNATRLGLSGLEREHREGQGVAWLGPSGLRGTARPAATGRGRAGRAGHGWAARGCSLIFFQAFTSPRP